MKKAYFTDYCGRGPYDESWLAHSRIEHCISIVERVGIQVRTVLVLGAATGRVLEHLEASWGIRPSGCEISRWAHARIPARFRRGISCRDMRPYVRDLVRRRARFDLCFSNALVYLRADEMPAFLDGCSRVAGHFHFWSSTTDDCEPGDTYRVTLRSRSWWRRRFLENGFAPTRSPYLWRSERLQAP